MRRISRVLPVPVAVATVLLFAACEREPPSGPDATDLVAHHRPGHEKGGGDDGGGNDGGGDAGPITVVLPDDLAYGGFGIATTGTGGQDLTGTNTADGIDLEGAYSLRYDVDTSASGACPASQHPLVALFDEVELASPRFTIRFDKEADGTGSFELNDRIRMDLNDLADPDGDPEIRYSVWFRGKGNPEYDPHEDVEYQETTDARGRGWTSVRVQQEDVFVKRLRCRNRKCKSMEVLERDVCELAASYSLKVSR